MATAKTKPEGTTTKVKLPTAKKAIKAVAVNSTTGEKKVIGTRAYTRVKTVNPKTPTPVSGSHEKPIDAAAEKLKKAEAAAGKVEANNGPTPTNDANHEPMPIHFMNMEAGLQNQYVMAYNRLRLDARATLAERIIRFMSIAGHTGTSMGTVGSLYDAFEGKISIDAIVYELQSTTLKLIVLQAPASRISDYGFTLQPEFVQYAKDRFESIQRLEFSRHRDIFDAMVGVFTTRKVDECKPEYSAAILVLVNSDYSLNTIDLATLYLVAPRATQQTAFELAVDIMRHHGIVEVEMDHYGTYTPMLKLGKHFVDKCSQRVDFIKQQQTSVVSMNLTNIGVGAAAGDFQLEYTTDNGQTEVPERMVNPVVMESLLGKLFSYHANNTDGIRAIGCNLVEMVHNLDQVLLNEFEQAIRAVRVEIERRDENSLRYRRLGNADAMRAGLNSDRRSDRGRYDLSRHDANRYEDAARYEANQDTRHERPGLTTRLSNLERDVSRMMADRGLDQRARREEVPGTSNGFAWDRGHDHKRGRY